MSNLIIRTLESTALVIQAYVTRRLLTEFIWAMILVLIFLLYMWRMAILFFSIFIWRGHENPPILMLLMLWSMVPVTSDVLSILFVWRWEQNTYTTIYVWQVYVQNCEKQLLASSYLSVRMEQLGFHWMVFREIWCWWICGKFVELIQFVLKSDKNIAYFTWRPVYRYKNDSVVFVSKRNASKFWRQSKHKCYI